MREWRKTQLTQDDPQEERDRGKKKRPGLSLDGGRARESGGEEEKREGLWRRMVLSFSVVVVNGWG